MVNLDKNGNSLRPAISWLDQRQNTLGKYPGIMMQLALRVVGMREAVIYSVKNGECNWLMQNSSGIWEKTDKFLFLSGYLTFVLTGEFTDSIGCTVGYVPFDYKKQDWADEGHMNFKMFPVEREKLPVLVKPSGTLGYISKAASEKSGIPQGLPLIAAAADKACEVLGSGVVSPDVACLSYGTTSMVQTTHRKYFEVIPFFPAYPSAIPDYFNMPAYKPHTYETSSLGAAINAAVGMKYYQEYNEAVKSMTRAGEQYLPDSNNVHMYDQLYEKVYSKMYKRLQPMYDQIRNITGYPQKI